MISVALKPKSTRKPVYFRVEKLIRPGTGEEVGALVPLFACDKNAMRQRGYAVGSELRAELKKRRNVKFHRLGHAIGELVRSQIDGFDATDAHDAFKQMQRECGASCEEIEIDLGPLGKAPVKVAKSISFDEMDEGEFRELVAAVCGHIARKYWPAMTAEQVEAMAELMVNQDGN